MTRNFRNAHSLQQPKIGEIGYDDRNRRANIRLNQEGKNSIGYLGKVSLKVRNGFSKVRNCAKKSGNYAFRKVRNILRLKNITKTGSSFIRYLQVFTKIFLTSVFTWMWCVRNCYGVKFNLGTFTSNFSFLLTGMMLYPLIVSGICMLLRDQYKNQISDDIFVVAWSLYVMFVILATVVILCWYFGTDFSANVYLKLTKLLFISWLLSITAFLVRTDIYQYEENVFMSLGHNTLYNGIILFIIDLIMFSLKSYL